MRHVEPSGGTFLDLWENVLGVLLPKYNISHMDSHPGLLRAEPTRAQVPSLTVPTALVRLSFNSVL